ncbi:MAG TPA: copper resistance protein, partial [Acetobacteraceae bacterium]|nr:copper resistance protein [Acetobacteraceae bacterium]
MSLLIDLFGYLSIVLHGLVIVAQSMALGGVFFLVFLARPFAGELREGAELARRTARLAAWGAVGLVVGEALTVAMQSAVLMETLDLPVQGVLGAEFAVAGLVKMAGAAVLALCLFTRRRVGAAPLLGLCAVILAAAVMTTHAAARLEDGRLLMAATGLHILGAAIWIGGIPCLVLALRQIEGGAAFRLVGARFSRMSMLGVLCIIASAAVL